MKKQDKENGKNGSGLALKKDKVANNNNLKEITNLSSFKMGWEKVKLGDICEVYGGTTSSTAKDEYWNGDVVWLSPTDLPQIGEVVHVKNSAKKITSQAVKELKAVVGMSRSFGAAAYQQSEGGTLMPAQACKE